MGEQPVNLGGWKAAPIFFVNRFPIASEVYHLLSREHLTFRPASPFPSVSARIIGLDYGLVRNPPKNQEIDPRDFAPRCLFPGKSLCPGDLKR